jgi:hypothetical protein
VRLYSDLARSPFIRSLQPSSLRERIPPPMLAFHISGGECRGPLHVERGNMAGSLIASLGMLPGNSPKGSIPEPVVVTSRFCAETGGVQWRRVFPGNCVIESRWYFDESTQLAVDSFTYLGISDFAAFGFALEPVEAPHIQTSGFMGFRHVTKAV